MRMAVTSISTLLKPSQVCGVFSINFALGATLAFISALEINLVLVYFGADIDGCLSV